jgi:hypothetical protein
MAVDDKEPVETAVELKLGTQFTSNVTTSGSGKSATNYVWSTTSNPGVAVEPQLLIFEYEINMYYFTREFLQGTCEERLRNAVVESRVLHARNLCNLFCGFGEQGDIWLSDILDPVCGELLNLVENASATQSCESSLTVKVRFHARNIHLGRPFAGDPGKAWHPGRPWRGGGRITGGQTPAAHYEACAASCAEFDLMGSAAAGSLCAFGVTQTPEQDGCDTEAFHPSVLSPRLGEAQVSPAL